MAANSGSMPFRLSLNRVIDGAAGDALAMVASLSTGDVRIVRPPEGAPPGTGLRSASSNRIAIGSRVRAFTGLRSTHQELVADPRSYLWFPEIMGISRANRGGRQSYLSGIVISGRGVALRSIEHKNKIHLRKLTGPSRMRWTCCG